MSALSPVNRWRFKFREARKAHLRAIKSGNHGEAIANQIAMNLARWRIGKLKAELTFTANQS